MKKECCYHMLIIDNFYTYNKCIKGIKELGDTFENY